jgi:hypothetical protein
MFSKPIGLAILVVACVGAAAAGGFIAARQNAAPTATEMTAATPSADVTAPAAAPAVQETEAVVDAAPAQPSAAESTVMPQAAPLAAAPIRTTTARASRATTNERRPANAPNAPPRRADEPKVEWTWPNRAPDSKTAASAPSTETAAMPAPVAPPPAAPAPVAEATPPPPAVPEKVSEEVVVGASSVIGLQLDTAVSSERARVEDRVEARVTRDVSVGGQVAVPAGTRVLGSVAVVDKGGKFKERARLGIRFHTLVLGDGTRVGIRTETIYREGDSPAKESAAKVGGSAIGGAILGAIFGGAKGAAIGGSAGAAAGSATVMTGDRNAAIMPVGTPVTVRLSEPVTITVER